MVKVSFVLSVLNGGDTLPDALESALGQTMENFELITVDDGSTDNSLDILNLYAKRDSRVKVLSNPQNIGIVNSLNRAISFATGSFIARLDHDDFSISTRLEHQLKIMDDYPDVGVVSCYVDLLFNQDVDVSIRNETLEYERRRRRLAQEPENLRLALPKHNVFHHGEVVFRKSIWQSVGGYRPFMTMAEDYDLWLRMSMCTQFYVVPEVLYVRRFSKANATVVYSDMMQFVANLARECYNIRLANQRDDDYALSQFITYLKNHNLTDRFSRYLEFPDNIF